MEDLLPFRSAIGMSSSDVVEYGMVGSAAVVQDGSAVGSIGGY